MPQINDSVAGSNEIMFIGKCIEFVEIEVNDMAVLYFINENETTSANIAAKSHAEFTEPAWKSSTIFL